MKKRIAIATLAVAGMASSALGLSGIDNQGNGFRAALTYGIGPYLACFNWQCHKAMNSWPMAPITVWGPLNSIVAA
ncbi:MAG: hypothetical protein F4Y86_15415 [Gammaproteobacteria bacterium]|nr:hypothetical protein [Gammaproteobacteria bacterium]MXY53894.1 hypothetical protein [Gammaproteobacteria bacterium]MYB38907.1 hypothetical protein [Gammaproteobacteria bacterium]